MPARTLSFSSAAVFAVQAFACGSVNGALKRPLRQRMNDGLLVTE